MSKKKGQQKKEIVPAFDKSPFWQYKVSTSQITQKVDTFITTFNVELKALIDPTKTFQENYSLLAEKMGHEVHPCLAVQQKKESKFPALINNDYGEKYVIFLSHKIDIVTIKLFGFLLSSYKLNSLKISNNNLTMQEANEVRNILEKEDTLSCLFFEWNAMEQLENRKDVILSTVRPSLQHLILRDCRMGDQICKEFIPKIKALPQQKLKSLDLYGNQLSAKLKDELCSFVEESKTLQFLGLSKNNLNDQEFISKLFNSIGEISLTEQEYEEHKLKEKARDEVIEKNKKKKKGAADQPIPFVFEIKETESGRFYVKNTSIKILNISNNELKDSYGAMIKNFAQKQGRNVQLFIEANKFSKKIKEGLKLYENLIV